MVLDEPKENDDQFEVDGITYLVDKGLSAMTGKIKLDYVDSRWSKGFAITSEKPVGGASGCGSSCSC